MNKCANRYYRQKSSLQTLITALIQHSRAPLLLKFAFGPLTSEVDSILANLCSKTLNITTGIPYHQILYSFRISRNDFRGAASILYDRLQRLKSSSEKAQDPRDESIVQCYGLLVNTLCSVGEEEAYVLAEQRVVDAGANGFGGGLGKGIGKGKGRRGRRVVTLEMVRREFQEELDRVGRIERGSFAFIGGEWGDEDVL